MLAISTASDAAAAALARVEAAAATGGATLATTATESAAEGTGLADIGASADNAAVALTRVGEAAAGDIPSVADLNAQFAAMQARFAEVSAQADAEQAAMLRQASANDAASFSFEGLGAAAASAAAVLGTVALVGGAVAAVVGGVAVKMAGDFQAGITSLSTGAGELDKNLGMVSQGILQMAVDTGTSTQELIAGMFNIESAGYRGAQGLEALRAAVEGAHVGETSLADVTSVLITSLHDYHLPASDAVAVTNSLIATVSSGVMHMSDLNAALTNVLSVASTLKVPLSDVEAALATMSAAGDKGASAGTHLAMMFKMLASPASSAAKEMAAMGIDSVKLAQTMRTSLPAALAMIQDAVAKHFKPGSVEYNRAIAAILGGSKSGIAGLELMGKNFQALKANALAAAAALKSGSKDVTGWSAVQKDFNTQLARAGEVLQTGLIKLGLQLLPIITPLVKSFVDWASSGKAVSMTFSEVKNALQPLFSVLAQVGDFLKSTFAPVWQQLVATFNHQVLPAWQQFMKALGPAMPALKLIGMVIGGVVILALMAFARTLAMLAQGAILAFGLIVQAISATATGFLRALAIITTVATTIKSIFTNLAGAAIQWGKNLIQGFINGILSMIGAVEQAASNVVGAVKKFLGFHSPAEMGPGKDADQWAPNFTKMYIAGLRAGIPQVQAALDALTSPMGRSFNLGISGSGLRFPAMGSGSTTVIVQIPPNAIALSVDGHEFVNRVIGPHVADIVRFDTGSRRPA